MLLLQPACSFPTVPLRHLHPNLLLQMGIWLGSRRVCNLNRCLERDDIYFSNPWPWRWKMHVSGSAKAAQIIIFMPVCPASCLDLTGRVSGRWCMMPHSCRAPVCISCFTPPQDCGVVPLPLWKAPVKCKTLTWSRLPILYIFFGGFCSAAPQSPPESCHNFLNWIFLEFGR